MIIKLVLIFTYDVKDDLENYYIQNIIKSMHEKQLYNCYKENILQKS